MSSQWQLCDVSQAENDVRWYVKDVDVLDSHVKPLNEDPLYHALPEQLRLWDSRADYRSSFRGASIAAKNPMAFDPDPWEGDFQNLYKPENSLGVPWDNTVYDESAGLEYPKGFLKPTPPVVTYNVDPYEPTIELDIPPFDIPEVSVPYLVLPDFEINNYIRRRGLRRINITFDGVCMKASTTFTSNSTIEEIVISWNTPPPSSGKYALMVDNGVCYWQKVNLC